MKAKSPFLIALFTLIAGVFIAILFGVNEHFFKDKIAMAIQNNTNIQSITNESAREAKINKEKSKNWRYYQRFHFHSTGIGAMSLGVLLLLGLFKLPATQKLVCSYLISIGGLLYPYYWLLAAIYGPIWGRTQAKETFAFLGYTGGFFLLGLIFAFYLVVKFPMKKS